MTQSEVRCGVAGFHVQIDKHRGLVLARAKRCEIDGGGCGPHAAFYSNKRIHPAELAALPMYPLDVLFEAGHRIIEFGAFQRLLQKVSASQPHRTQQEFLAAMDM